jgi:hypothetical protein
MQHTETPPADAGSVTSEARLAALADALGYLTVEDLCLLAKVTDGTAANWRKRGLGPTYAMVGNRPLYPRDAVAEFLRSNVRERRTAPAKGML